MAEDFENKTPFESVDESRKEQPQEGCEKRNSGLGTLLRERGRKYGDQAESRLNAMPVERRKKWFFVVFGLLLGMLIFNFVRTIRKGPEQPVTVATVASDSIIDWMDDTGLFVMNLDSLAAIDTVLIHSKEE